jgi:hypothetical protein
MRKPLVLFLLPFLLLASCQKTSAPKEIQDFLNACSVDKAISGLKTAKIAYQSRTTDRVSGEEKGQETFAIEIDRTDMSDYYSHIVETYSGTFIPYDSASALYLTSLESRASYSASDSSYHLVSVRHGYESADQSGESQEKEDTVKYTLSGMKDKAKELFYTTTDIAGYVSGGLYYADFFKSNLKYSMYMSLKDDLLSYTLTQVPYKTDTEEGLTSETLTMNALGMLLSLAETAENYTTAIKNVSSLSAVYDQPIVRS